jgi:hypothetical protein
VAFLFWVFVVTPTILLFIIATVGVIIIVRVAKRCIQHIRGLGGNWLGL